MIFEIIVVLALYWIAWQNNVLKHRFAERVKDIHKRGYDAGHSAGYKCGHDIGYQEGQDEAFDEYAVYAMKEEECVADVAACECPRCAAYNNAAESEGESDG